METCDRCEKEVAQLKQLFTFFVCEGCYNEMQSKVFRLTHEDVVIPCPFCGDSQVVIVVDNMEKPIHPADYQMAKGILDDYEKDTGKKWKHFPHVDVNTFCETCGMPGGHMTFESRDAVNSWIEKRRK